MLNIKEIRARKCMQQKDLQQLLGVNQSTLSMWETGKANPRIEMLPALAKALDCRIDDLFKS